MQRLLFLKRKQRQMLLTAQQKLKLSQHKISKFLKTKRRTYRSWLYEETTLPIKVFEELCSLEPSLKDFEVFIKKKLPSNWGQKKGGNKVSRNSDIINKMKEIREIKDRKRIEAKKKIKINENLYLRYLKDNKIDFLPLLATCLLTDGSVSFKENRMEYTSKDIILKDIVFYFFHKLSRYPPLVYYDKNSIFHVRLTDSELIFSLLKLTPSFKTSSAKDQPIKDYLKEKQPTVNFLQDYNKKIIKECIRLAFTTDGSITHSGNLLLSCSHPKLCKEWKEILDNNGIKVSVWKNITSWSGLIGVGTSNIEQIKNFQKIGGFIPRVKVSLKSKYHIGWEKNKVLKYIIDKKNKCGREFKSHLAHHLFFRNKLIIFYIKP